MAKKTLTAVELRAQAKALLEKAKRVEMESRQELGDAAIKFVKGEITEADLKNRAIELGVV
jgi:hypothetical protein